MMMKGTCYGILYIPQEFDKSIVRGQQGVVEFYSDMSLLIYYKNFSWHSPDVTMGIRQRNTCQILTHRRIAITYRYSQQSHSLRLGSNVQSRVGICIVSHSGGNSTCITAEHHSGFRNAGRRVSKRRIRYTFITTDANMYTIA